MSAVLTVTTLLACWILFGDKINAKKNKKKENQHKHAEHQKNDGCFQQDTVTCVGTPFDPINKPRH